MLLVVNDPLVLFLFGFRLKAIVFHNLLSITATKGLWYSWMMRDDGWRGRLRRFLCQRWLDKVCSEQ